MKALICLLCLGCGQTQLSNHNYNNYENLSIDRQELACRKLKELGCPEGKYDCKKYFDDWMIQIKLRNNAYEEEMKSNIACISRATFPPEVRVCGIQCY
jgi:hypothetical protein